MKLQRSATNRLRFHRVKGDKIKSVFKSTVHVFFEKNGLLISQGSAATHLRSGRQCYVSFVANFITFLAVK